jgi:hypothetical protein
MISSKARVDTEQIIKAAHEQAGADDEDECRGHFRNHHVVAHAGPRDVRIPAATLFEVLAQVNTRQVKRRNNAEEDSYQHSDNHSASDHSAIHADAFERRQEFAEAGAIRYEPERKDRHPIDRGYRQGASEKCQHEALGHELPDHSASRCTQGKPNGHLARA